MANTIQITMPRALAVKFFDLFATQLGEVAVNKGEGEVVNAPAHFEKKPRPGAGQPTAWSEWVALIKKEHKADLEAYVAQRRKDCKAGKIFYTAQDDPVMLGRAAVGDQVPEQKAAAGAHHYWLRAYKAEHEPEWLSFKEQWEADHPKVPHVASVPSAAAPASSAEAVEEETEEAEDDLLPFSKGGISYLRWGHLDAEGEEVWHPEGWTWLRNADGSKGAFAGKMIGSRLNESAEAKAGDANEKSKRGRKTMTQEQKDAAKAKREAKMQRMAPHGGRPLVKKTGTKRKYRRRQPRNTRR